MGRELALGAQSKQRSAVANGNATLLGGKDERAVYVRRMKEIAQDYVADLGGIESTSTAQRSLIRRAAVLTVEMEKLETRLAEDPMSGERTLDLYSRTAGNLRRILETLGVKRPGSRTVSIGEYLAAKRASP
jgi:hypothetical protein